MKLFFILFMTLSMTAAYAQHDQHSAHHAEAKAKPHDPSKTFTAPKDLKVRMEKIAALTKDLEGKKADKKAMADFGTKISDVVSDIFKTCKLEPEADAAVHPALGTILAGTEELKAGKYEGAAKVEDGLKDYKTLFGIKK